MKAIVLMVGALCSCATTPADPTGPVEPPKPVPEASCKSACDNGAFLGCAWAVKTPGPDNKLGTADDGNCLDRCIYYTAIGTPFNEACLTAASSCAAAELCAEGAQ